MVSGSGSSANTGSKKRKSRANNGSDDINSDGIKTGSNSNITRSSSYLSVPTTNGDVTPSASASLNSLGSVGSVGTSTSTGTLNGSAHKSKSKKKKSKSKAKVDGENGVDVEGNTSRPTGKSPLSDRIERKKNGKINVDTNVDPQVLLTKTRAGKEIVDKVVNEKVKEKENDKLFIKRRRFLFPFGIILGLLTGLYVLSPHLTTIDPSSLPATLTLLLQNYDFQTIAANLQNISFQNITDNISINWDWREWDWDWGEWGEWDWGRLEFEWESLRSRIPEVWKFNNDGREYQVGESLAARNLSAVHPVILVPGIISTGLESWSTSPPYKSWFRQKVWGGFAMISQVTFNHQKWLAQLMLDPETGLDPPGVKVRAAQGFDAAASFIQGYWIWSKIIENLAVVNYDTNNLHLAAYDWRLSFGNLEVRDGYFTMLKTGIERMRKRENQKVVLVAHSMGASVVLYFFKWVESPLHGGGGPNWVEENVSAFITIAGTHLGVPKAMTAFLSGEMKDTVELNPAGAYVLERFLSRNERAKLFRSWAGSASMWIKGGDAIWGNLTQAPDDHDNSTLSHGRFFTFRPDMNPPSSRSSASASASDRDQTHNHILANAQSNLDPDNTDRVDESTLSSLNVGIVKAKELNTPNMTMGDASTWILQHTPSSFQKMLATNFSFGIERDEEQLEKNNFDPTKWGNPLEARLPYAPSLKIYCVYGHGKETERSYWYARGDYEYDESFADTAAPQCFDGPECSNAINNDNYSNSTSNSQSQSPRAPLDMPLSRRNWIDFEVTDEKSWPQVRNGVQFGEGDGTVSLLSLGTMCTEGWKRKRYNPAGVKVVTVELPHNPTPGIPRGGANTSDHVDILGASQLNEIILKVAVGVGDEVTDSFVSDIREYVKKMQWD